MSLTTRFHQEELLLAHRGFKHFQTGEDFTSYRGETEGVIQVVLVTRPQRLEHKLDYNISCSPRGNQGYLRTITVDGLPTFEHVLYNLDVHLPARIAQGWNRKEYNERMCMHEEYDPL